MNENESVSESHIAQWRADFPILRTSTQSGKPLVYLDSAATSQKPQAVLDALTQFYASENANVHRGIYGLSELATDAYESSRRTIAEFIGSCYPDQLVLTHGATEAINMVAASYVATVCKPGDEILLTVMEHHANIVPWQMLAEEKELIIRYVPLDETGALDLEAYAKLLSDKTCMVAFTHVSNVLGTINPVKTMTEMAHAVGAKVLIDGAQACPQIAVDVSLIDCDFYVASAHKCYAPSGVGLLYGRPDLLEMMRPYQTGGSMIETVEFERSTFLPPPMRFEAGTPAIAETIAWAAAFRYLQSLDLDAVRLHKLNLQRLLHDRLQVFPKLKIHGHAEKKVPVVSFTHEVIHPHDLATILDSEGVAVRAGHHCAMPLHRYLDVPATTRASLSFYNDATDIDALVKGLEKAEELFA